MKYQSKRLGVITLAAGALILGGCGAAGEDRGTSQSPTTATAVAAAPPRPSQPLTTRRSRVAHPSTATPTALGHRTKFVGCHARGLLPDPACTPGAIFSGATVSQICTPGYSRSVRNVPDAVKQNIYTEYGIETRSPGGYEVDHLISLELGGSNGAANLWPEVSPGYHEKDGIENRLHDAVCRGSVSLSAAQHEIARDWRHTFAGAPTIKRTQTTPPRPVPAPSARAPTSPASGTPADFCTTHQCIASFDEGHGTIVQCADGEWSHSGGLPGVCSRHGGVR
ncbi:MAG: hypothetical protein JWM29_1093 [Solirubrobacterales bacterium]|nr:hypothetical protein [Solirubrobacterales bacterium]